MAEAETKHNLHGDGQELTLSMLAAAMGEIEPPAAADDDFSGRHLQCLDVLAMAAPRLGVESAGDAALAVSLAVHVATEMRDCELTPEQQQQAFDKIAGALAGAARWLATSQGADPLRSVWPENVRNFATGRV